MCTLQLSHILSSNIASQPVRLCWNLAYADAYAKMVWQENTVPLFVERFW
jgi:hypothetical protein